MRKIVHDKTFNCHYKICRFLGALDIHNISQLSVLLSISAQGPEMECCVRPVRDVEPAEDFLSPSLCPTLHL